MSKIVCDVCGTSYADSAPQCPICGYVSPASVDNEILDNIEAQEGAGYSYVKGGRFSKANVRKRVKTTVIEEIDEYGSVDDNEPQEKKSDTPLVVTAVILLVAIAAIVLFITLRFFGPWSDAQDQQNTEDAVSTTELTTDDGLIHCTRLDASNLEIQIPEGGFYELKVIKEPADTTDELSFTSNDPSIATVDANGKITPVSSGTTVIIVKCGDQQIEIQVTCQVKEEIPFMLDMTELKLEYVDQEWILYSGEAPVADIEFSSDDDTVATFVDGIVYAKGVGETMVHAKYNDQTVSCKVICSFDEQTGEEDSGISEDGNTEADSNSQTGESDNTDNSDSDTQLQSAPKATGTKGYVIKTNFGSTYEDSGNPADFDISHRAGYELTFRLVDAYGNRVSATWKVYNTSICKLKTDGGSTVECLEKGIAYIVATTEDGETYVCTIRVV